jgi:hypothetical protein
MQVCETNKFREELVTPLFIQNFLFLIFLLKKSLGYFMSEKAVLASSLTPASMPCFAPSF